MFVSACAHPPTSRSGAVHDIRVIEAAEPADLVVNLGDEVRWVNARSLPIQVDLVGVKRDDLSCERGFSNLLGMFRESAAINPNESASACFSAAGAVSYNVRMDSAFRGGERKSFLASSGSAR